MKHTNRRFGRLTAISIAFAIAGLAAAYGGIQGARNAILNQISTNSAEQWAEILSFSISDPSTADGLQFESMRVADRVAQAVSDGLILWYGGAQLLVRLQCKHRLRHFGPQHGADDWVGIVAACP